MVLMISKLVSAMSIFHLHLLVCYLQVRSDLPVRLGDKGEQRPLLVTGELHLTQIVDEKVELGEHGP